jgi:CRP-like cAMP-binding protein
MYMNDEEIFQAGDKSNGIYLILKGKIQVHLSSDKRVPILSIMEQSFFGENFVLDNEFENCFRVTSKRLTCLFIPKQSIEKACRQKEDYRTKLRNFAILKKAVIQIEERKFNDRVVVVVNRMIHLKREDAENKKVDEQEFKSEKRWYKKKRVFNNLLKTAIERVDSNVVDSNGQGEREYCNEVIEDYIHKIYPD